MLAVEALARCGLDGAKVDESTLVMLQNKLHGSITEMAYAIKEQKMGPGWI
ncbi:MAG: hypothetical protein OJI67_04305 [Prosthecobacter sp.]|nr:hypothetical protein [Prosthecobacter sp.]